MKISFDLCEAFVSLSENIYEFIENVEGINEESITDYLLWQIKKINKGHKFNFVNPKKFTKLEENQETGADFELEFWIIDRKKQVGIPFVIQAKKFIKDYDGYCGKINYQIQRYDIRQVDLLIDYCKSNKKLPFYLIYSPLNYNEKIALMCGGINWSDRKISMVLIDAIRIKKLGDKCLKQKAKLSKRDIIRNGNPFCCLFCCPYGVFSDDIRNLRAYLGYYYESINEFVEISFQERIPRYVMSILYNEISEGMIKEYELFRFSKIAVLDISNND